MAKEYRHKNGYSAVLYGKSSLIIYYDGKEVIHTGFRNVNTKEEVMKFLENQPKFMKMLENFFEQEKETDTDKNKKEYSQSVS